MYFGGDVVWHRDLALLYTVERDPPLRVLAVGWLGLFTFRRGATPLRFQELLSELCRRPPLATLAGGSHRCLMGTCLWRRLLADVMPASRRRRFYAGNGAIIVPGAGDKLYCAPTLIAHYVHGHRYRPPREFVEAVLALDGPGGLRWEALERLAGT